MGDQSRFANYFASLCPLPVKLFFSVIGQNVFDRKKLSNFGQNV